MFTINQNLIDDFADKINEKEKKSNKVTSLSSSSTNVEYPSAKAVYDAIDDLDIEWNNIQNKPALFSGSYADLTNKPSYTPTITSSTNGAYKIGSINISGSNVDIYGKDTDTHQDISGKIDTAGTGLSKSGTTLNHSNSITALATTSLKKIKYDSQGHITGTSDVASSDLPSHTHSQYLTSHQSLSNYYNKSETNNYDVDFILGTQTTSTSAWTGTTSVISSLRAGTTIFYRLPYASTSTSVTLNLTLKGGGTTGAKNVFYKNTTRVTTHFGVGQVVGLTYDGTAWYVISPSDNNSNNDNTYGGIQFKAGEALTTQTICCAKNNGQYYKVANGVVLDIRYPLIMTSSAVTSGTTTNAMYRTWYAVNIANTKSMTLTNGSQLFLEGTAYSDGKFTISSNVVTHTLTNGRYYIKVGTALSTTQIRFISDMTVYYYNGTTLKPAIKKEQIVDFPTSMTPTNHASGTNTYGLGNSEEYGHVKSINNLTTSSNNDGECLSAYQGKILNDKKLEKTTLNSIDSQNQTYGIYNTWDIYDVFVAQQYISDLNITDTSIDCGGVFQGILKFTNKTPKQMYLELTLTNSNGESAVYCSFSSNSGDDIDITTTKTSITLQPDAIIYLFIEEENVVIDYAVKSNRSEISVIADMIYPVGSIYMSVNNNNPQILFGGRWEQLKDRFLLGSGDTYTNASTGGEATHTLTTDEMPSHTHIQNSHNHTQNSHNHTQNSHNHTQNAHNHALTGSKSVGLQEGSKLRVGYGSTSDSKNTNNATATNKATTATNQATTATNNSQTATNQNTGGGQAHNNMPPYLVVYMWKRTA